MPDLFICPSCGGHLTVVPDSTEAPRLFVASIHDLPPFRAPEPFAACDACELVYDGVFHGLPPGV